MAHNNLSNISFSPGRQFLHNLAREQDDREREEEERLVRETEQLAREKKIESAVLSTFYSYQQIHDSYGTGTRVLVLKPGGGDDKLAGRLEPLWIGNSGDYKALSYVWGEPRLTDAILIDGKKLAITESLGAALRRLRPPTGRPALRIWIDQICINQRDTVERNKQVRLMHAIFRAASQILVWLGPDADGHASRAFQLVGALRSIFDDKLLASLCKSKGAGLDWIPTEYWKSLRELSRLPWFRRAWIPQEIGTDAEAVVHWGSENIGSATLLFHRFVDKPRPKAENRAHRSFVYQLCLSARTLATDPRDYVYSQLGHHSAWVEAEQAIIIQPDYDNAISTIYHEIAIRALSNDSTLMLLNAVSDSGDARPPLPGPDPLLPTWVPRWDAGRFHSLVGHPGRYRAAGSSRSGITSGSFEDGYKTLVVKGIVVDTIAKVTPKFTSHCFVSDSSKKDLFTTQGAYRGDASVPLLRAFLDTLAPAALVAELSSPAAPPPAATPRLMPKIPKPPPADSTTNNNNTAAYHSGLAALHKLFPSSSSYSSKHDPRKLNNNSSSNANNNNRSKPPPPNPTAWLQAAEDHAVHRCFAVTQAEGKPGGCYFAMAPPTARPGDALVLLAGGETPYVLRPVTAEAKKDRWVFVGEAYVPGLMGAVEGEDGGAKGDGGGSKWPGDGAGVVTFWIG
ncbi:heterokaryon incompatibility protein-domain-containing protein [Lasiosphaeria ovina]|uniref:Heterokaryon incompatibility protein-domain-containing protein n=1 Tax=Lasiosphaeria ovina TaxID=92902 RepID=A0AAE0JTB5_9PEZI|nr:heterokaryon incompatibility protein-domain-containing protein [Lasiosphaeria ovina]